MLNRQTPDIKMITDSRDDIMLITRIQPLV
jgi:hypothetical protein